MRSAGSRASEVEEKSDGNITVIGPPLPAVTGIAAWDSALLEDYHRRKRAQQLAAAAAKAAAAEASGFPGEDAATASTATAATAAVCPQIDGTFCEENNDDDGATSSESVGSTSTFSSGMAGSSDSGHEGDDSAQAQGGQDAGLDSLDHGSDLEVDGGRERSIQETTNEQQPAHDSLLGGGELGLPIDQDPEEQHLRDSASNRAELLEEGEPPSQERPSGGGKPLGVPGERSKNPPPHPRRRKRKLRGLHGAMELATRCLRKDGFNAKAYGLRAELEARLGRRDRAIADFRAAASLEVGDSRPRINMVCKDVRLTAKSGRFFSWLFTCLFTYKRDMWNT